MNAEIHENSWRCVSLVNLYNINRIWDNKSLHAPPLVNRLSANYEEWGKMVEEYAVITQSLIRTTMKAYIQQAVATPLHGAM